MFLVMHLITSSGLERMPQIFAIKWEVGSSIKMSKSTTENACRTTSYKASSQFVVNDVRKLYRPNIAVPTPL